MQFRTRQTGESKHTVSRRQENGAPDAPVHKLRRINYLQFFLMMVVLDDSCPECTWEVDCISQNDTWPRVDDGIWVYNIRWINLKIFIVPFINLR